MKIVLLMLLLPFCTVGQSVETQQLLLNIEKLAQMKAQYQTMVNGYRTLQQGYHQVSETVKGNYLLHKDYLDGLLVVSPAVSQYGRIKTIVERHAMMVDEYKIILLQLQAGSLLKPTEIKQMKISMTALVNASGAAVDEMLIILTPGKLRMNDEERIGVINRLDQEVGGLLEKMRGIAASYRDLFDRRFRKQKELQAMKLLYGIKP
jgi:hypothetical protein